MFGRTLFFGDCCVLFAWGSKEFGISLTSVCTFLPVDGDVVLLVNEAAKNERIKISNMRASDVCALAA